MASRDVANNAKCEIALKAQTISTDTTTVGETIDTAMFEGILLQMMTGTITDGDYEFQLFEGDESDMSDESEVAAGDIIGTLPDWTADTDDDKIAQAGYTGAKRYIRLKVVSTNTSSGGVLAAIVSKELPRHAPASMADGT